MDLIVYNLEIITFIFVLDIFRIFLCSLSLRFLDILAARKDPAGLSGEVLIDGAPQPPNFKCLSGYVVQVNLYFFK